MVKVIALAAVLLLLMVVVGVAFYLLYEKPVQEEAKIQYHNLSIRAFDPSHRQIQANYTVQTALSGNMVGSTLSEGFTLASVPVNQSLTTIIYAPGYYTSFLPADFPLETPTAVRIEPTLTPIGDVEVYPGGRLGLDNPLPLTIRSRGYVRDLKLCVRWSNSLLSVSIDNKSLVDKEERIKNKVDKCYDLNVTLGNGESETVQMQYKEYLPLTSSDSVQIHILYGDRTLTSPDQIVFTSDGKPAVKEDHVITIKP